MQRSVRACKVAPCVEFSDLRGSIPHADPERPAPKAPDVNQEEEPEPKHSPTDSKKNSGFLPPPENSEEAYGQPLPQVGKAWRVAQLVGTGLCSAFLVSICFTASLAASGLWPVPGHKSASFWGGFLNRLVWALSPCFLGSFFPGLCNPTLMTKRSCHVFFLLVSLVPFVIANISFPYAVGTENEGIVFFSTCFWPTTTCIFFLPSMVAGIRHCRGDDDWYQLCSQVRYIRQQGRHFWLDLLSLVACFLATVLPVNYIALDFAVVMPNMSALVAAVLRPLISMLLKGCCVAVFKVAASGLGPTMHRYGMFPLALNLGLHTSLAAAQCRDWPSVGIWVLCDCAIILWRAVRARHAGAFRKRFVDLTPWLSDEDLLKRMSFEAIILGWGLTAALSSLLVFSPLAWVLPRMLQEFLLTSGLSSVKYLAVVCICDVSADILSIVYLTHLCNCDFSEVLGHPFSGPVCHAYISSLAVVWAPCALGCFGWVFQHMCVSAFKSEC